MASKFMILLSILLFMAVAHSLPVGENSNAAAEEDSNTTETPDLAAVESSSSEQPEGTIFNYEIPTEEELNPSGLDEEQKKLQVLQPPAIDSEMTFYAKTEKPRKGGKKYNPDEKWINKNQAPKESSEEDNEERQYALLDFIIENLFLGIADQYNQNQQPRTVIEETDDDLALNQGEYIPNPNRRSDDDVPINPENERVVFQIHGHLGGPKSYKFGFDTGKKDDRQFRFEEQDNDGTLRGQYGYVDKRGRAHVMNYTSSAKEGFRIVRAS